MRLKFPILALILEIITIVLYALFVVYDTGDDKGHGDHHEKSNQTANPMTLYPSMYLTIFMLFLYQLSLDLKMSLNGILLTLLIY